MSKSIKLKNDNYIDSSSITHKRIKLSEILNKNNMLYATTAQEYHKFSSSLIIPIGIVLNRIGTELIMQTDGRVKIGKGIEKIKVTAQCCPRWDCASVPIRHNDSSKWTDRKNSITIGASTRRI